MYAIGDRGLLKVKGYGQWEQVYEIAANFITYDEMSNERAKLRETDLMDISLSKRLPIHKGEFICSEVHISGHSIDRLNTPYLNFFVKYIEYAKNLNFF